MRILTIPAINNYGWCGLALFYATSTGIWRVQLPRGKPVKLLDITVQTVALRANDKFVYVWARGTDVYWLFARDGTLLYNATVLQRCTCQLTGSGLAVYDHHANTVTTWPGGQSHAIVLHDLGWLSGFSTHLATPVFLIGGSYFTSADGVIMPVGCRDSWGVDYHDCAAYWVHVGGIYVHEDYLAGLLALRRGGLPKELRWHIMNY
jgi:hypothetical protein